MTTLKLRTIIRARRLLCSSLDMFLQAFLTAYILLFFFEITPMAR